MQLSFEFSLVMQKPNMQKSKNQNLPEDKKLDFEIWLDPEKGLLVKISYERMGKWEYILNNYR